jgi:benzoate membrane transport protein
MLSSDTLRRWLPALGTAIPLIILFIAVLSILLAAAQQMRLSEAETSSWILVVYGLPGLLGLVLVIRYRQPLLLTGNIFVLIFIASLGARLSYPELVGASIVAGASVVLISALGLTGRLAAWIPAPIVLGLLAGAVMPFVSGIFTSLGDAPALVGGAFLAYLLGHRYLGARLPAILPALVVGLAIAALTGELGQVPARSPLPVPTLTTPVFSVHAIATATPVLVILITLQSNLPSVVFLRNQEYHPPERMIDTVSGVGTLVGSLLGPTAVSLSLPATALVSGPEAGEHELRHRSVYLASGALVLIGVLAGIAADLPEIIPLPLLLALAGLAVVSVLANALQQIAQGPLLLGPLFAFAIALSKISMLGFGPFFWALVIGTGISLFVRTR